MNYTARRHIIKIPKNISMYYCDTANIIVFANSFTRKALLLKTKLIIENKKRIIKITREPLSNTSTNEKRKLKAMQGTQVSLLKQILSDISLLFCKKLDLIGVGFRVSALKIFDRNLLHFKLGYSHFIYFKIPKNLKIFCLKANKLFILGYSYLFVTQIAALIRSYKVPEPYKGKGIVYTTETIVLKEGKKV
jgi:large subunit ribosomal protein L6|uniref:Ribosomal protein L6 n=1 Tax=Thalassiosira rotula TaxID=49265 RepID=A0A8B0SBZ5_9STRA|nr:ribosomal protein L6 [Thalassiosira rotula]QTX08916.1 ribosomal protein L6 [Thalassiosira rotula]